MLSASMAVAQAPSPVDELMAELRATPSATATLQQHCGSRGRLTAVKSSRPTRTLPRRLRAALHLSGSEAIGYRRVRLMCGTTVFSQADNWFVPSRLPVEMAQQLATSDTPFGRVVAPLMPTRQTLSMRRRGQTQRLRPRILTVEAIVSSGAGVPLSAVIETYRREVVSGGF
jgi:chorismate-pyruvate lyase